MIFFLFLFTVTREQALVQKWYNKVVLAAVYPFIRERDILQSSRTHEGTRTPMKYDRRSLNGAVNIISQKKKKEAILSDLLNNLFKNLSH